MNRIVNTFEQLKLPLEEDKFLDSLLLLFFFRFFECFYVDFKSRFVKTSLVYLPILLIKL